MQRSQKQSREDSSHVSFAGPERDARIVQQRNRLTGLRFKGEEECSHACILQFSPCSFGERLFDVPWS